MTNRAEKIIDIYNKFGSKDYIGEKMTQTEHALQCAYYAKNNNYDKDIIISALLHDIGHLLFFDKNNVDLMDMYGVAKHENIGAEYLKKIGFNDRICNLIKNHVNAKRYLCSVDNTYYNKFKRCIFFNDNTLSTIHINTTGTAIFSIGRVSKRIDVINFICTD